ncbi:MAG: GatB/YqeY domain-containing protein [Flavobacteriales bacterium]|nr:GatB/YqeY domain-containing protein [Flavobacteriales bacterium]
MNLTDQINQDIKEAMKAREAEKLAALRDVKSKLLLEMTKDGSNEVDEGVAMKILNKLYKQRMETAQLYKDQGREDLAEEEIAQAQVIKHYLPEQLDETKIREIVSEIVSQTGASGMGDMGKVMGMATQKMAGRADGKVISGIVRELLA